VVSTEPKTERDTEPPTAGGAPPSRRIGTLAAAAIVLLILDVVSKALVVANLEGRPPVRLLGGLIYLDVIRNAGAAFSMATGMTWVFSVVMIAVAIAIVWVAPRLRSTGWALGLGLVLAGALGNLIDRLFRGPGPMRGYVVDFLSLFFPYGEHFAVFNVADCGITVGGAVIAVMALLGRDYDGTRMRERKASAEGNA